MFEDVAQDERDYGTLLCPCCVQLYGGHTGSHMVLRKLCIQHETLFQRCVFEEDASSLDLHLEVAQQVLAQKFENYMLDNVSEWRSQKKMTEGLKHCVTFGSSWKQCY
eukprot:12159756-Karenia_brevis.AAC.1